MTKPVLGLALGGALGVFDGLSALVSAPGDPNIKAGIVGIVIGSTIKGILTGALIGWFARRTSSLAAGIVFGMTVGLALAYCVSLLQKLAGQPAVLLANHAARRHPRHHRGLRHHEIRHLRETSGDGVIGDSRSSTRVSRTEGRGPLGFGDLGLNILGLFQVVLERRQRLARPRLQVRVFGAS